MVVSVVIGANFGDEGKGQVTDWLAGSSRNYNSIVVRFNGGAQAGHTVIRDNFRHVFHHFGSGTLFGVPTYLSKDFIVNPILFKQEYEDLDNHINPVLYCDTRCMVTTPWDMILNQVKEDAKKDQRHGSCGVGINETYLRQESGYGLRVGELLTGNFTWLYKYLETIRLGYFFPQLQPNEGYYDPAITDRSFGIKMNKDFIDAVELFVSKTDFINFNPEGSFNINPFHKYDEIIFEGAQGLLLSEDSEYFPHVTRGYTGLRNLTSVLHWLNFCSGIHEINLFYVSRSYLTRHGNGPLPGESVPPPWYLPENTNVDHQYQGRMRFGKLDVKKLVERISNDISKHIPKDLVDITYPGIVFTHMNASELVNEKSIPDNFCIWYSDGTTAKDIWRVR